MKTLAIIFSLLSVSVYAQTDSTVVKVKPEQAKERIGKITTVCGRVACITYTSLQFNPVYLNFSKDYPNQPFAAVISREDFQRINPDPFKIVTSRQVCVTGLVEDYKGKPQIVVKDSGLLEIQ